MARITPLSLEEAQILLHPIGFSITAIEPLLAGSVNSNFRLRTPAAGDLFLRIYEEQDALGAAREWALQRALLDHGLPVAPPLPGGLPSGLVDTAMLPQLSKPVGIFAWVTGTMRCQSLLTPAALTELGLHLRALHAAGAHSPTPIPAMPPSRFRLEDLLRRVESLRVDPSHPIAAEVQADLAWLRQELDASAALLPPPHRDDDLPVIHGDLFRDNVLWHSATVDDDSRIAALLDLESASTGSRAYDLAVTALAWCYGDAFQPALLSAFFAGYQGVLPNQALPLATRQRLFANARIAALRFAITRITDFELRPQGTGSYKDYRRFLARYRDLLHLGESAFLKLCGLDAHP